jgi:hypothetical protein
MKRSDGMPRYTTPSLVTLTTEELAEALGPAETQYAVETHTVTNCLVLQPGTGDTTQDNWTFNSPVASNPVTISVDSTDTDAGPLDPKVALYPPGQSPALGAEFTSPAECTDPLVAPRCIEFGGMNCTAPSAMANTCPTMTVTLTTTGTWTVSIGTDAPNFAPQSEGCYALTVTGLGLSEPQDAGFTQATTFLKARR